MNRRKFTVVAATSTLAAAAVPSHVYASYSQGVYVRLGGPIFDDFNDPEGWIRAVKSHGYRAAYCPLKPGADEVLIRAYREAAAKNDIVISEVGAWSNPISPDAKMAREAMEKCIAGLQLADSIGANCCVNISGSRNPEYWAGPHEDNLSDDTFDLVVETTRKVIDAVKPTQTHFALEPMPWAFPYSADSYLRLLKAIDRPRFGVHFDPVNMVVSPQIYFRNGAMIREAFKKLGPYIRSCHAKDITLREDNYIPQLDECRPGTGKLNYAVFLKELSKLPDIPLMMEHLKTAEEYAMAANHIRAVGKTVDIAL